MVPFAHARIKEKEADKAYVLKNLKGKKYYRVE